MSRASDKRELLRLAAHFRTGPSFHRFLAISDALTAGGLFEYVTASLRADPATTLDNDYAAIAREAESLAYEEPPRNGYVDDVTFVLPEWPASALEREYKRGFAAGVASLNTERAELRAQVEALQARVRALTPKKGRGR